MYGIQRLWCTQNMLVGPTHFCFCTLIAGMYTKGLSLVHYCWFECFLLVPEQNDLILKTPTVSLT